MDTGIVSVAAPSCIGCADRGSVMLILDIKHHHELFEEQNTIFVERLFLSIKSKPLADQAVSFGGGWGGGASATD